MILAVDPGREKCGLAVLDRSAKVLEKRICATAKIADEIAGLVQKYRIPTLVLGDSTGSRAIARLDLSVNLVYVTEKNSTLEARRRYFKENPPQGWRRLIPSSLLVPPVPIDDYAAVILGERYLKG
ncbi:resolvase [Candidatus Saganbacteria bacterium]|nr:resolvase [Candidatus Saganbacteria bacterium]